MLSVTYAECRYAECRGAILAKAHSPDRKRISVYISQPNFLAPRILVDKHVTEDPRTYIGVTTLGKTGVYVTLSITNLSRTVLRAIMLSSGIFAHLATPLHLAMLQ
jgi:hypothetical protein